MEIYSVNDQFEIVEMPTPADDEYILYINYFGIKNRYLETLKTIYGEKLIIDDTHDFFQRGHKGHWSFCSARKYFGVPDGAYLYAPVEISRTFPRNNQISIDHLKNRLAGDAQLAYQQFLAYESSLNSKITMISEYSEKKLARIDMDAIRHARKTNYLYFHDSLKDLNQLNFEDQEYDPFCYPMLIEDPVDRHTFHRENIFIPTLWPDLLKRKAGCNEQEKRLAQRLLPLPVDHRYEPCDLERVVTRIRELRR